MVKDLLISYLEISIIINYYIVKGNTQKIYNYLYDELITLSINDNI